MCSKLLKITVVTLFALYSTAQAQTNFTTNWNPTGEGCVDTTGFLSCYGDQSTTGTSCTDTCIKNNQKGTAAYNTCITGCQELWFAGNIGCWIQSCWNQVYSCAYQLTAMSYFDGSGLAQNDAVPFYPPPNDASAGACSCNLGYVYGNLSAATTNSQGSNCEVISGGDTTTLYNCECCEFSWPISNILNACPKSNLAVFGFQKFISTVATTLAPSADKCAILKNGSETCINDYNFPWAGATAYNPLALPSGEPGTEALSNTAGNAFTVFPSPVTTLSLLPAYNAYTSVITPAAFAATASANPQSISGTSILGIPTTTSRGGGVATTNGQSTGTGTAASTTATKASSGMKIEGNPLFLLSTVVLVVIRIL